MPRFPSYRSNGTASESDRPDAAVNPRHEAEAVDSCNSGLSSEHHPEMRTIMGTKKRAERRRRISDAVFTVLLAAVCIPVVIAARILRPFHLVRFSKVGYRAEKIGHFAFDVALAYAEEGERRAQGVQQTDLYYAEGRPGRQRINEAWLLVTRSNLRIHRFVKYLATWNDLIPGGELHARPVNSFVLDRGGIITKHQLRIPASIDRSARTWMKSLGWNEGESFVCLHVRDNAFHGNDPNSAAAERSSDIERFSRLIQALTDRGIWVFRTGRVAERPSPVRAPRFVDYAFHEGRSDELDVWLFANSTLTVSTGSGPDMISSVFGRPVLFVDVLGLDISYWANIELLPRRYVWRHDGRDLTFAEFVNTVGRANRHPSGSTVKVVHRTPDEIASAVQQRLERLVSAKNSSGWQQQREDFLLALRSTDWFPKDYPFVSPDCGPSPVWMGTTPDAKRLHKPSL